MTGSTQESETPAEVFEDIDFPSGNKLSELPTKEVLATCAVLCNRMYDDLEDLNGLDKIGHWDRASRGALVLDYEEEKWPPMAYGVGRLCGVETLMMSWRGSVTFEDWKADILFGPIDVEPEYPEKGKFHPVEVHQGIWTIAERSLTRHMDTIRKLVTEWQVKRIVFTGHSLGGGIATLAQLKFRADRMLGKLAWDLQKVEFYTVSYGAPMTIVPPADKHKVIDFMRTYCYNLSCGYDIVALLPGHAEVLTKVLKIIVEQKALVTQLMAKSFAMPILKFLQYVATLHGARRFGHVSKVIFYNPRDEEDPRAHRMANRESDLLKKLDDLCKQNPENMVKKISKDHMWVQEVAKLVENNQPDNQPDPLEDMRGQEVPEEGLEPQPLSGLSSASSAQRVRKKQAENSPRKRARLGQSSGDSSMT